LWKWQITIWMGSGERGSYERQRRLATCTDNDALRAHFALKAHESWYWLTGRRDERPADLGRPGELMGTPP
jgi:hypothetical protein